MLMLAGGTAVPWTLPWTLAAYCAFELRRMKIYFLRVENCVEFPISCCWRSSCVPEFTRVKQELQIL